MPGRPPGTIKDPVMPRYCLVVLDTPLVAQDLALTLSELTGCVPITVARIEEAEEKLADLRPGALSYAFIHTDAAALRASRLRASAERLGARMILLGHAAEVEAGEAAGEAEWPVLPQPFGPAQVAEMLQRCPPAPRAASD